MSGCDASVLDVICQPKYKHQWIKEEPVGSRMEASFQAPNKPNSYLFSRPCYGQVVSCAIWPFESLKWYGNLKATTYELKRYQKRALEEKLPYKNPKMLIHNYLPTPGIIK